MGIIVEYYYCGYYCRINGYIAGSVLSWNVVLVELFLWTILPNVVFLVEDVQRVTSDDIERR